jgi:N-acetyl-anhydromuramyl-L-alanine amidase AmpD
MSTLDGDIQILNNNAYAGRDGKTPKVIIVHGTASNGATSAVNIANYFRSTQGTGNPVSTHYVIDKDGTVVRCNNLSDGAWGNGGVETGHNPVWDTLLSPNINPNNITFSIEHVKFDVQNADVLTDAQKASSFKLIAALCDAFNIPKHMIDSTGGITGHFSLAPLSRQNCPGPYPFDQLISYLQGASPMIFDENSPLFATFFTKVTNQNWLCKSTGKHLTLGMLEFYKTLSFDPQHQLPCVGLPLTEETYVPRPDNAPLSYILFERGALIYDPQHVYDSPPGSGSVYIGHINTGVILELLQKPVTDRLAATQAQLNTCQNDLAVCEQQTAPKLLDALQKIDDIADSILEPSS